ncbi:hypothetical protein MMC21_003241, partial [Puttea exsequens]|nr:hypothetical protein [Puttea exsequens]
FAAPELAGDVESPLLPPPPLHNSTRNGLQKTNPAFHLIVPASESNPELCKSLLSSFVLSYPSATLVNYGKRFDEDGWDKGSHAGKIRGVFDFLSDKSQVKDDDLVLIVDGYDAWFQLPPEIMIRRYHTLISEANERLRRRYGMVTEGKPGDGTADRVQKYTQKVIFGADKICWPNPKEDPACAAVPYSTLPKDAYGPDTDKDPEAYHNRPRFLNSGTVIGPAEDIRAIYNYAVQKVEKDHRGTIGDQFVFAEIFGEQEYQRETLRRSSQGTGGRFYDWLSNTLGTSESPLSANITINNMTTVPGQRYEYSIGLDYTSRLFQTMTHSAADLAFLSYNSSASLASIRPLTATNPPLFLPLDLQSADPPFSYASPGNHTPTPPTSDSTKPLLLPYSPHLDTLPPAQDAPSWLTTPLATNTRAASIPPLLHLNGDKSLLDAWWPNLWFHPYARALLRQFIRSTQTLTAAKAAADGGQKWWDSRGGRGGVWTDGGRWMAWGEVCRGVEAEVFADGLGVWAKEEGGNGGRVVNSFGKVIVEGDE